MKDKIFHDLYRQMSSTMEEIFKDLPVGYRTSINGMNAKMSAGVTARDRMMYFSSLYRIAVEKYFKQHGKDTFGLDEEIEFTSGSFHCSTTYERLPYVMYKLEVAFKVPVKDRYKFVA